MEFQNFIHLCKPPVQAETPEPRDPAQRSTEESLSLGFLLAALASEEKTLGPLPEDNSQERRSYSMEHFRWGKPAGRKRRPIKVFASPSEGGDSVEGAIPSQARREADTTEGGEGRGPEPQKKDGAYRMGHFRWGGPPAAKRYGGFMRPWVEQSQKPLLTLFKNVMVKDV
ncbi:proopiomelanocortin a [Aplochiton taeniatus]